MGTLQTVLSTKEMTGAAVDQLPRVILGGDALPSGAEVVLIEAFADELWRDGLATGHVDRRSAPPHVEE